MTVTVLGRWTVVVLCITGVVGIVSPAGRADWPAYRHGPGRCAATAEGLAGALHLQWTHVPSAAPSPAWPDPVREIHMMAFDHAFHVVAAGGVVYFGSSSDHQVHALDLATGRRRWRFFTDAPVRFAPAVRRGRLYVAGDDGCVYCLSADEGKLIWRHRPGADERIMGNEQMISRWPLRSGLLVADGVVYFTAGMWPAEGVWAFALNADDGKVIWKVRQPEKMAPQGYLAAGEKHLVAPAGRAKVWVIDRADGTAREGRGHSWAMVAGARAMTGQPPFKGNENLAIKGSPKLPPRKRSVNVWPLGGKGRARRINGKGLAAADDETCYAAGDGKVTAYAMDTFTTKWEADCGRTFALAVAGRTLAVGGEKTVTLLSAETGKRLWSAAVDGQARGLAVADGRLLVSTHTGRIYCFGPKAAPVARPAPTAPGPRDATIAALAANIINGTLIADGFCLKVGAGDGRLALELARASKLRIYCAEPDAKKAAAARKLLADAGLYGTRVVVHHVSGPKLPYPAYFANLILADQANTFSASELGRVLRPCGGVALRAGADSSKPWIHATAVKLLRISLEREVAVRGRLPGAGQWTHLYADAGKSGSSGDLLARWPLRLLWFGKPGPGRMMQRHWRGSSPMCVNGRMFILGQHSIIAVDAYNGREIWSHRMPSIQRRVVDIRGGNMAADAEGLYVATSDGCLRFDAATGRLLGAYRVPVRRPRLALGPGRTFTLGDKGALAVAAEGDALVLTLTTKDPTVANADPTGAAAAGGDSWELFFDFRPGGRRTGLHGKGTCHAVVVPSLGAGKGLTWRPGLWSGSCPPMKLGGKLTADGSVTTVRIAWNDIARLVGRKPVDFAFGAILNSSDDGQTLTGRTYKFANAATYRLSNCLAVLVPGPRVGPGPQKGPALPAAEAPESLAWGQLFVQGDVILATAVEQGDSPAALLHGWDFSSESNDYTGPPVAKVLGIIGVKDSARYLFALGKADGRTLWVRPAAGAISHNAIAVGPGRVYVIDRAGGRGAADMKRRGRQPPPGAAALEALDLATGRRLWRLDEALGDYRQLRLGHGVLLAASMKGMTAYSPDDGKKLWSVARRQPMHHCSAFVRAPVITRKWIYDEPHAYDLRTGKPRILDPIDTVDPAGETPESPKAWLWSAGRGCGTVSGAENMLFYRAGPPVMFDTTGAGEVHTFGGIRPGCYINIIAAGGLVLMPEASSGCGCPYNFQTTVVMMPK